MGYYVRILSTSPQCPEFSELQRRLKKREVKASLILETGNDKDWEQLLLKHSDGTEIAVIERNLVTDESLAKSELAEFSEEIQEEKPASAVPWLLNYFERTRCIYAFQLLNGTDHKNGWEIFAALKNAIWSFAPSIIHADGEGFSNEDGYHILWQFRDSIEGSWWMGVLKNGRWIHFQMDLKNRKHREAFFKGEVPEGVKLAD